MHAIELPFVFYDYENYLTTFGGSSMPEDLAAATQDAWIKFAETGGPN